MNNHKNQYQSCNHILLVEPEDFASNPQTRGTNPYQHENPDDLGGIRAKAIIEHQNFRNEIIATGIAVTTTKSQKGTPDEIFGGNCYSTHQDGTAIIYSMMAENRRAEKRPPLTNLVIRGYDQIIDYSEQEEQARFLEGTGSMVMDHINNICYASLSDRTHEDMVNEWCATMGYTPIIFHSTNHLNESVYHTDLILYIGTTMAGFVSGCVDDADKERVLTSLQKTHDVVEFTKEQLIQMVGNCLEVRNHHDEACLICSDQAYNAWTDDQRTIINKHYKTIIHPDIQTIEKYGGGSARCLILELF